MIPDVIVEAPSGFPGNWTAVQLAALIAGPICLVCVVVLVLLYLFYRNKSHQQPHPPADPEGATLLPGKNLQEMLAEYSYTGSGSGQ